MRGPSLPTGWADGVGPPGTGMGLPTPYAAPGAGDPGVRGAPGVTP